MPGVRRMGRVNWVRDSPRVNRRKVAWGLIRSGAGWIATEGDRDEPQQRSGL